MTVTVIVPARNAAMTIGPCVMALRQQVGGRGDLQILVVDDGSVDLTCRVAAAAGAEVISIPPAGPAVARNIGVKAAFGFPVMVGKEVAAVLEFFSPQTKLPDQLLMDVMEQVGIQLGRVIERERVWSVANPVA